MNRDELKKFLMGHSPKTIIYPLAFIRKMGANLYVCLIQKLVNLHYIQVKGNTVITRFMVLPLDASVMVNICIPFLTSYR